MYIVKIHHGNINPELSTQSTNLRDHKAKSRTLQYASKFKKLKKLEKFYGEIENLNRR